MFFRKKVTIATHSGNFHSDDIFAVATLSIFLKIDPENLCIKRTRDEKEIKPADYVLDVGLINDGETRFDHHQKGGAGNREDNIPYASVGLVWKKFGAEICGNKKTADLIEKKLIEPIDAYDNGINLCESNFKNVFPYTIDDVFNTFSPTSLENIDKDKQFLKAVSFAVEILKREIKKTNDQIKITEIIQKIYKNSSDKRLIIIDTIVVSRNEVWNALQDFTEPLFVVYKGKEDWSIVAMKKESNKSENRKNFPVNWGGLKGEDLVKVSGVKDALFCHNNLFLSGAKTEEGAIKLAELAIESKE